jgi:hypothetical protein
MMMMIPKVNRNKLYNNFFINLENVANRRKLREASKKSTSETCHFNVDVYEDEEDKILHNKNTKEVTKITTIKKNNNFLNINFNNNIKTNYINNSKNNSNYQEEINKSNKIDNTKENEQSNLYKLRLGIG